MPASGEVRRLVVRSAVLIGGVFVLTVLLAAMPGHRVPVVDAQSQQAPAQSNQPVRDSYRRNIQTPTACKRASEKHDQARASASSPHTAPHTTTTPTPLQPTANLQTATTLRRD